MAGGMVRDQEAESSHAQLQAGSRESQLPVE